jgi:hypothetical protein
MDPVTAYANLLTALLNFLTEATRGQSVEQKAKMWEWFITDTERWRRWLKLDKEP